MTNPLLATDSYKQSHFKQYPPEARRISAYLEARPNPFSDSVLFFGLQTYMKDVLLKPITASDIKAADRICAAHGVPFNREGWEQILTDHGGLFPLEIKHCRKEHWHRVVCRWCRWKTPTSACPG